MLEKFVPDKYYKNIYVIDYKKLKSLGIKCILFDLDNTIVPTSHTITVSKQLKNLFNELRLMGFKVIIMSNSSKSRVSKYQTELLVDCAAFSMKPKKDKYEEIMKKFEFKEGEICAVGDQLMTDIYGANRMGIMSILVNPMSLKDFTITFLNRFIEQIIFKNLSKKEILIKGVYYD